MFDECIVDKNWLLDFFFLGIIAQTDLGSTLYAGASALSSLLCKAFV